ncbi:siderophore-interacting protein [Embleya sp. NBC_00896]|uniref:siderophore-interacting protein n=1 Tax=Embleya sp. NBC_00896 TaxID=2975961 RepID=UPI002F91BE8C|nr:siderophore-interacting protein [Embleya sp. NBC_00896]
MRNAPITRNATRITLTGPDLANFVAGAPDQRVKLFVPREGRPAPRLALEGQTWREAWERIPEADRPHQRTFTVRAHRSEPVEIDIDFALHSPGGPASRWARSARVGDPIDLLGPTAERNGGYSFEPPSGRHLLLVGDQAALPAIGSIVESLPADARGDVFVEVTTAADRQDLVTPPGVRVRWLYPDDDGHTKCRLLSAVQGTDLPADRGYAWIAGEAGRVRALRRHLVHERGMDRRSIAFMGYWRVGHTEDTAHARVPERQLAQ